MSKINKRKNELLNLFKVAFDDKVYDGEDVYDYSEFIKKNFYDPDTDPDLKIDIQDSDQEIVEEFDGVLERLEMLVESRFSDEETQPHDFMKLFTKELQDMTSQFDYEVIKLNLEELNILYSFFRQYLGLYSDYEHVIASNDFGVLIKTAELDSDGQLDSDEQTDAGTQEAEPSEIRPETMNSSEVGHIQAMLAHLGYDLGRDGIDGDFGRKTFRAIRRFQSDNSLPSTGVVDERTMENLNKKAPDIQAPSAGQILSSTSRKRLFERTRTEEEASEDVDSAIDIISEIANSGSFSAHSGEGGMSNLELRRSVKLDGMDRKVRDLLGLINEAGSRLNTDVIITSGFRTPADQSRIMFYNWNRKGGTGRGSSYLLSLYSRFNRIGDIAEAFEQAGQSDDQRKAAGEQIITDAWQPFRGHLDGLSLDVSFRTGKYKVGVILSALQELGIIRLLEEDDHYHLTAKEVPSPRQGSMV